MKCSKPKTEKKLLSIPTSLQCLISHSLDLKDWFEGFFSIFQKFEELFNLVDYFLI